MRWSCLRRSCWRALLTLAASRLLTSSFSQLREQPASPETTLNDRNLVTASRHQTEAAQLHCLLGTTIYLITLWRSWYLNFSFPFRKIGVFGDAIALIVALIDNCLFPISPLTFDAASTRMPQPFSRRTPQEHLYSGIRASSAASSRGDCALCDECEPCPSMPYSVHYSLLPLFPRAGQCRARGSA